jgi:hypothetical protein
VLAELLAVAIFTSSCDVTKAALGGCGAPCPGGSSAGSFTICESKSQKKSSTTAPKPNPQRLCKYYVNGTIDVPTLTIISAWVDVGSRLCIGDPIPEPAPVVKTVREELEDAFSARLANPKAWLTSRARPEPQEPVGFEVESFQVTVNGSLFGDPATIRFRPVSYSWTFSDGSKSSGDSVTKIFAQPGQAWGKASVRYEVDYRKTGAWTLDAASWSLTSNTVNLEIFDPPRKTLLVR